MVDGYQVAWQNWKFVIGFNAREGLTLHHPATATVMRTVPSSTVPPSRRWWCLMAIPARRNGERTLSTSANMAWECANSLELGCDCLGLIRYFDAHMTTSRGEPLLVKNAICMHEEDYGILWKHTDRRLGKPEVRRSRRLVVSSVSTVENYEYGFFWYLYQDGNIQFEVKLTGVLSLGTRGRGDPAVGALVADQVYAPNHQHFFNVRLDFDLDGRDNSVQQIDVVPGRSIRRMPLGTRSMRGLTRFLRNPRHWPISALRQRDLGRSLIRSGSMLSANRSATASSPATTPCRSPRRRRGGESGPGSSIITSGSRPSIRTSGSRRVIIQIRVPAATVLFDGPWRIGRSHRPMLSSGIPSATPICRGPRTIR